MWGSSGSHFTTSTHITITLLIFFKYILCEAFLKIMGIFSTVHGQRIKAILYNYTSKSNGNDFYQGQFCMLWKNHTRATEDTASVEPKATIWNNELSQIIYIYAIYHTEWARVRLIIGPIAGIPVSAALCCAPAATWWMLECRVRTLVGSSTSEVLTPHARP